jgi:hypothetical protein
MKNLSLLSNLTHLTINIQSRLRETLLLKINKNDFPKFTSLSLILWGVNILNIDFPLLETFRFNVMSFNFGSIINIPNSLKHMVIKIQMNLQRSIKLEIPSNLIYLSLELQRLVLYTYQFKLPETLKYLTLKEYHNSTINNFPSNLIYLNIDTDNQELIDNIKNLSQLKYLKLHSSKILKPIRFPHSLRCLEIQYNYMNIIPKFVKYVVFTF